MECGRRTHHGFIIRWKRPAAGQAPERVPEMKGGSRPVSRVLSRAIIPLGRMSPHDSSDLPGSLHGPCSRSPIRSCTGWGLPCHAMLPCVRCALTAPFHPCLCRADTTIGGLLSVALSVGSRRPGVTWHPALWSPDFPRRHRAPRLPGRLPARSVSVKRPIDASSDPDHWPGDTVDSQARR